MSKNLLYIGNKLSKHGFSLSTIETLGPLLEQEGFKVLYASDKKNPIFRLFSMLSSIVRNRKIIGIVLIDTYSTYAFYYAWASSQLCRLLNIIYIPILHGGNLPDKIQNSPFLCNQIFNYSQTNIVISGYLQKYMEEKKYKYSLIPNNIDIGQYKFLHRINVSPRLLWVRAFHKIYNPQLAVQVVAKLAAKYPDITLTMIGPEKDGSLEECKKLSVKLGVENRINFTGKLCKKDWIAISEKHDIFINTTNFDNLPVSVIEAMALGIPVISTNVGGIPYLINNGENGLLVEPDNESEMISAVIKLLDDSNLVCHLSSNGKMTAASFDWMIIKEKWRNLFSEYV